MNLAEILAFFVQTAAIFLQKLYQRKTPIFSRNL
jgi:hypothetical protein